MVGYIELTIPLKYYYQLNRVMGKAYDAIRILIRSYKVDKLLLENCGRTFTFYKGGHSTFMNYVLVYFGDCLFAVYCQKTNTIDWYFNAKNVVGVDIDKMQIWVK